MTTLRLDSEGSVFLTDDLLAHLGARAGSTLEIEFAENRTLIVRLAGGSGKISDTFGMMKREGQKGTKIEEVNEIIEKGWAGEQ